ncbi:MAG: helix-turn-helix transcriptional regulator [Saprospiraceae bacterium]|nr:helix-turn-helix transcriptional regulator [Saprospiraceae bacterium]
MRVKHFNLAFGAQFFKALGEEARIRILYLLYKNKELTISDIELILEFTQTKTARHLTYLKNSGLVSSKKRDQWVFYYLKDEVYDILNQVFPYLRKDPVLIADEQVIETLNSNRELAINKLNHKKWRV